MSLSADNFSTVDFALIKKNEDDLQDINVSAVVYNANIST